MTRTLVAPPFGQTLLIFGSLLITATLAGGIGAHSEHEVRFTGNDGGRGAPVAGGFGAFIGIPLLAGFLSVLNPDGRHLSFSTGIISCFAAMIMSICGTAVFMPAHRSGSDNLAAVALKHHIGAAFGSGVGVLLFGFLTIADITIR